MDIVSPIRDYPPNDLPRTKLVWRDSKGNKWRKYVRYTEVPNYAIEWLIVPEFIAPQEGSEHAESYVHEDWYRTRCGHRVDLCQCVLQEREFK